jgi:ABC-type branched-subunit amino acid transport system ATPase component
VTPVLEARSLSAGYHGNAVIHDIELELSAGKVAALLGANGAGTTTTLLTLAGELQPLAGEVWLAGARTMAPLHRRALAGLSLITEERSVFMGLTVAENLRAARCDPARALEMFPELEPLLNRRCAVLSGGEQQMLAVAQALARRPKLFLADELSLGLAPQIVTRLLNALRDAAVQDGVAVLLVEQHVHLALRFTDEVHVMSRGRIVTRGKPAEIADDIERAYLGAEVSG